jgi:hypothetical protein
MQDISKEQLAEARELAAFVTKHIQPIIDIAYPAAFGANASKNHSNFGTFTTAAAMIVAGKLIADAIRESGGATVEALKELDSAIMTTV